MVMLVFVLVMAAFFIAAELSGCNQNLTAFRAVHYPCRKCYRFLICNTVYKILSAVKLILRESVSK